MRKTMTSDIFHWHGYVDIWLNGKWVKATPAFNISLTNRFNMLPLDFDGENDSIYHPFDKSGNKHMEYLNYRGVYVEVPREEMVITFGEKNPKLTENETGALADQDFEKDVEAETRGQAAALAKL